MHASADTLILTGTCRLEVPLIQAISFLASGNAVIILANVLSPLHVIDYFRRAQVYLPRGVLQVVIGDEAIGDRLSCNVIMANETL